jgi:hypothetical protein
MTKTCGRCGVVGYAAEDFYMDRGRADTYCKGCRKEMARDWKARNHDRVLSAKHVWRENNPGRENVGQRLRDRRDYWANPEAARQRTIAWWRGIGEREREMFRARRRDRYASDEGIKIRARLAVSAALKSGRLVRPDLCVDCLGRRDNIEAHHDDYSYPLVVVWLCSRCHGSRHRKQDTVGVAR